jgi:hypothetical protein
MSLQYDKVSNASSRLPGKDCLDRELVLKIAFQARAQAQNTRVIQAYLENLLRIRPFGVVSKKLMGARNMAKAMRS